LAKAVGGDTKTRRRTDVGVFLVSLGIGAFGNFYFGKVEVGATFLLLAVLALGDLICSMWLWRGIRRLLFDIAFTVFLMWACSNWLWGQYRSQHAALLKGDLVADDDGKDHSNDPVRVRNGRGYQMLYGGPNDQVTAKTGNLMDRITAKRVNGKLQVSLTVRDENDNLIVQIINNHWEISSSKTVCWDKNYTRDSLEVLDGAGRVVLQLRILQEAIELQVEWKGKSGPATIGNGGKFGFAPMFLYPSDLHWAEFDPDWVNQQEWVPRQWPRI